MSNASGRFWRCLGGLLVASIGEAAAVDSYSIDPKSTIPSFEVRHLLIAKQHGRFGGTTGTITLDRDTKTGSIEIIIDAAQLDTGGDGMEEYLRAEDFFDVARHPTMRYSSDKLIFEGERPIAAEGLLSLRGVTRPVLLAIKTFRCAERACSADAWARIKRSDFGMNKWFPWVANDVLLKIQVEAVKN